MKVLDVQNLNVQYHTGKRKFRRCQRSFSFDRRGEDHRAGGPVRLREKYGSAGDYGISAENAEVEYENLSLDGEIPVPGYNIAMIFQDSQNCPQSFCEDRKTDRRDSEKPEEMHQKRGRQRALELLGSGGNPQSDASDEAVSLLNCPAACGREW